VGLSLDEHLARLSGFEIDLFDDERCLAATPRRHGFAARSHRKRRRFRPRGAAISAENARQIETRHPARAPLPRPLRHDLATPSRLANSAISRPPVRLKKKKIGVYLMTSAARYTPCSRAENRPLARMHPRFLSV